MKQLTLFIIAIVFSISSFAQSEQYINAMEGALSQMKEAEEYAAFKQVSNVFERIGMAETTEWLPSYYQAYCNMNMAITQMQEGDMEACVAHLDKAQSALDQANERVESNSELVAMQGYIYQGRIWSDPQVNGPVYAPKSMQALQQAIQMDEANPRPYHLMGQNLYFTPAMWGGGPQAALPHLEKAATAFENFEPVSSIYPSWGEAFNTRLLEQARKKLEAAEKE
ncbi:MAG: hypothetical protein MI974_01785 [Chitinophagales bacterium]|nr:hypothetical protein [Chitinophagales bacterium]